MPRGCSEGVALYLSLVVLDLHFRAYFRYEQLISQTLYIDPLVMYLISARYRGEKMAIATIRFPASIVSFSGRHNISNYLITV